MINARKNKLYIIKFERDFKKGLLPDGTLPGVEQVAVFSVCEIKDSLKYLGLNIVYFYSTDPVHSGSFVYQRFQDFTRRSDYVAMDGI